MTSYESRLEARGFTLDGYLNMIGQSKEELRHEFEPAAAKRLVRTLVLAELVRAEGIKVEGDDLEEEVDRIASDYGERAAFVKKMLSKSRMQSSIASDLYSKRAIDRLIAIATGQGEEKDAAQADAGTAAEPEPPEEDAPAGGEEMAAEEAKSEEGESPPEPETEDGEGEENTEAAETSG